MERLNRLVTSLWPPVAHRCRFAALCHRDKQRFNINPAKLIKSLNFSKCFRAEGVSWIKGKCESERRKHRKRINDDEMFPPSTNDAVWNENKTRCVWSDNVPRISSPNKHQCQIRWKQQPNNTTTRSLLPHAALYCCLTSSTFSPRHHLHLAE